MKDLKTWHLDYDNSKISFDNLLKWFDCPFANDDPIFVDDSRTILLSGVDYDDNKIQTVFVSVGLTHGSRNEPLLFLNTDDGVFRASSRNYEQGTFISH